MRKERVIKKVALKASEGFGSYGGNSYWLVMIDHINHQIQFESMGGCAADIDAFTEFCTKDKDVVQELKWAAEEYKRKYPCWVDERTGMSGASDILLFISKADHEWAIPYKRKVVCKLHISMYEKLNQGIPDFFAGDLLEILKYMNVKKSKDKKFTYIRFKAFRGRDGEPTIDEITQELKKYVDEIAEEA